MLKMKCLWTEECVYFNPLLLGINQYKINNKLKVSDELAKKRKLTLLKIMNLKEEEFYSDNVILLKQRYIHFIATPHIYIINNYLYVLNVKFQINRE